MYTRFIKEKEKLFPIWYMCGENIHGISLANVKFLSLVTQSAILHSHQQQAPWEQSISYTLQGRVCSWRRQIWPETFSTRVAVHICTYIITLSLCVHSTGLKSQACSFSKLLKDVCCLFRRVSLLQFRSKFRFPHADHSMKDDAIPCDYFALCQFYPHHTPSHNHQLLLRQSRLFYISQL